MGKGAPVDLYDFACRNLHWGYECAIMDGEDAGETCVPWETDYVPVNANAVSIYDECAAVNSGNSTCEFRACVVEMSFTKQLSDAAADIGFPDADHLHSSVNWDREAECKGFA